MTRIDKKKDCSGKNVGDAWHGLVHERTAVKAETEHSKSRKHKDFDENF